MSESISELRESVLKPLDGLQSELSTIPPAIEAASEILPGTIAHLRQEFEAQIAQHQYYPDDFYIERVKAHLKVLHQQDSTYATALRSVEIHTLSGLPHHLVDFIHDHENLYRAAIRSRARANRALDPNVEMGVFERILERVCNIDIVYALNLICETMAPEERERMQQDPVFKEEFTEISKLVADELVRILKRLEVLMLLRTFSDAELENVGADHDIDDFARDVVTHPIISISEEVDENDHSQDCCICLEAYDTDLHPGFQVKECGHIIGKSCLATWLNSISKNSNLCPHCRTQLYERRPRRPKPLDPAIVAEKDKESERLIQAKEIMEAIDVVHAGVFGSEGENIVEAILEATNTVLTQNRVGFGFVRDASTGLRGRFLRRVVREEDYMIEE